MSGFNHVDITQQFMQVQQLHQKCCTASSATFGDKLFIIWVTVRQSLPYNEVVELNIATTKVHPHIINDLTLMSLRLTDPSLLLIAKGEERFILSESVHQWWHEAGYWRSIKATSNLRNQFLSLPGFNRQLRILQCQWVKRRYSHLREVTADVMRFSVPCLIHTSNTKYHEGSGGLCL